LLGRVEELFADNLDTVANLKFKIGLIESSLASQLSRPKTKVRYSDTEVTEFEVIQSSKGNKC
jgi:hypothetical protein